MFIYSQLNVLIYDFYSIYKLFSDGIFRYFFVCYNSYFNKFIVFQVNAFDNEITIIVIIAICM